MEHFTAKDKQQIEGHGLSLDKVYQNLKAFEAGIPRTELISPATLENGIWKLTDRELKFYGEKYENKNVKVVKFVPASGAATRMFKELLAFLQELQGFAESSLVVLKKKLKNPKHANINTFFDHFSAFAFYAELLSETKMRYPDFDRFSEEEKKYYLTRTLLDENKLNFSNLPKGLVPFHKYSNEIRTAFEEHLFEAIAYSSKNNLGILHFTVTEKHLKKFENELERIREEFEKKQETTKFEVGFSFQSESTDTIASTMENKPFRNENGDLVFRPSGHGALLENLNQIDTDLIFIKNIDNVSVENNLPLVSTYKKALAGILLEIQKEAFGLLKDLQACLPTRQSFQNDLQGFQNHVGGSENHFAKSTEETIQQAKRFLKEKLNIRQESNTLSEIQVLLNRPIRICGMVKNTGAPGGGPFWIKDEKGTVSLQIVETAQIDNNDLNQRAILEQATHFNPVDLVCGVKNYQGGKFNLMEFSNPKRGFITRKSANGQDLKALELPGLWNGAMEYWNSVFIEVPLETFNPVKAVTDLLKPKHQ